MKLTAAAMAAAMVLASAACRNADRRLEDSRATLRSWTCAARMAARERAAGNLSRPFLRVMAQATRRAADDEARDLEKLAQRSGAAAAADLAREARTLSDCARRLAGGSDADLSVVEASLTGLAAQIERHPR